MSPAREQEAAAREENAAERDRVAVERDRVAEGREFAAAGAVDRERAGDDRERAAEDRRAATSDREGLLEELEQAQLDSLTGVYGRGLGRIALAREIERAERTRSPLVFIFVDVDGLKQVNDSSGHAAGDEVLKEVAAALRANVRTYDPVVRWGGDEFVCAMSGQSLDEAAERLEQVRRTLDATTDAAVSCGMAELRPGEELESVIARCDAALYESKRGGD